MLMNLIAIVVVAASGYMWLLRGWFSAFIHLMSTVIAGAVAFAVWEPLGLFLLTTSGTRGFFAELQMGSAWGIALAAPFIVAYALCRAVMDGTLRRNVFVSSTANYIGGGLCGGMAGVIVSGISVMSMGMLRLPFDMGMFDYQAVQISASGSVQRGSALWIPTDRLTSMFYGYVSGFAFACDTPMAKYYPQFYATVGASRFAATAGEGRARNTMKPTGARLVGSYMLSPTTTGKPRLEEMTKDTFSAAQPGLTNFDGDPIAPDGTLHGYVISFGTEAREKNGQVLVGNAQVYLVVHDADENASLVFPNAIFAKAQPPATDAESKSKKKDHIEFARFAFSSGGSGKYFPSVGSDSDAKFGFEFLVPAGRTPKALYVKGIRIDLDPASKEALRFSTASARDQGVPRLFHEGAKIEFASLDQNPTTMNLVKRGSAGDTVVDNPPESFEFVLSNMIGVTMQRDQLQGVTLVPYSGGWAIQDGECRLLPQDLNSAQGIDRALKVDKYEAVENQVVCQLNVSADREWKIGERGFDNDKRIFLVDDKGNTYDAIGFFYRDADVVAVRYTPGTPLKGMAELPRQISRSEPGQQCKLVFRVTKGVTIVGMGIGDKAAIKWQPRFRVDVVQTGR